MKHKIVHFNTVFEQSAKIAPKNNNTFCMFQKEKTLLLHQNRSNLIRSCTVHGVQTSFPDTQIHLTFCAFKEEKSYFLKIFLKKNQFFFWSQKWLQIPKNIFFFWLKKVFAAFVDNISIKYQSTKSIYTNSGNLS